LSPRALLILAFAALYVFWGTTYLGIRVAVETLPPFLMASVRFSLAGLLVLGGLRLRGPLPRVRAVELRSCAVVAGLLLFGANGLVVWAETRVPSGLAALLVATSPLWMVLFDWLWRRAAPPTLGQVLGLALGFAGLLVLQWPTGAGATGVDLLHAGALVLASVLWSFGSIWAKDAPLPESPLVTTALEMLCAGALLLLAALISGEPARLQPAAISTRSLLAVGYLILFGSIAGFSAFVYIFRHTSAALASTYCYVNPVIAVLLGWLLLGEAVSARTIAGAAVILAGVILVLVRRRALPGPAIDPRT
jgi:drug/metabolite transporter (DMT)-like permease